MVRPIDRNDSIRVPAATSRGRFVEEDELLGCLHNLRGRSLTRYAQRIALKIRVFGGLLIVEILDLPPELRFIDGPIRVHPAAKKPVALCVGSASFTRVTVHRDISLGVYYHLARGTDNPEATEIGTPIGSPWCRRRRFRVRGCAIRGDAVLSARWKG